MKSFGTLHFGTRTCLPTLGVEPAWESGMKSGGARMGKLSQLNINSPPTEAGSAYWLREQSCEWPDADKLETKPLSSGFSVYPPNEIEQSSIPALSSKWTARPFGALSFRIATSKAFTLLGSAGIILSA